MPADGQEVLAAALVPIFEDKDSRAALASHAEAFDVCVPDCLAWRQFSNCL
jgi:hypothetical protein